MLAAWGAVLPATVVDSKVARAADDGAGQVDAGVVRGVEGGVGDGERHRVRAGLVDQSSVGAGLLDRRAVALVREVLGLAVDQLTGETIGERIGQSGAEHDRVGLAVAVRLGEGLTE